MKSTRNVRSTWRKKRDRRQAALGVGVKKSRRKSLALERRFMSASRYTSNELYHLVGHGNPTDHEHNYQTLLKILDSCCVSHPPHNLDCSAHRISFNWEESIFNEKLIAPEITCFCDIPFESLHIHLKKYGMFGLSFDRELLIKNGARPVIYVPLQPSNPMRGWGTVFCETMLHDLEQIWRGVWEQFPELNQPSPRSLGQKPDSQNRAVVAMESAFTQHFLSFIKPFNSELPDNHPDNFYMEREWRKFCNLRFQPQDVRHVVVAPEYADRFKKDRPIYADADRVIAGPSYD